MTKQNNTLSLTRQDLTRTLDDLFTEVNERPGCVGSPHLTYQDKKKQNHYMIYLRKHTGEYSEYSVSCFPLKGITVIEMGKRYRGTTAIGTVILITVDAKGQNIEEFFD